MPDPTEIVACQTEDGAILHRTRQFADAWGLKILPGRKASDADGRPLPDKHKTKISEPAQTPDAPKEK